MRLLIPLTLSLALSACAGKPLVRETCLPAPDQDHPARWGCTDILGNKSAKDTAEMVGKYGAFPLDDLPKIFKKASK